MASAYWLQQMNGELPLNQWEEVCSQGVIRLLHPSCHILGHFMWLHTDPMLKIDKVHAHLVYQIPQKIWVAVAMLGSWGEDDDKFLVTISLKGCAHYHNPLLVNTTTRFHAIECCWTHCLH